MNKHFYVKTPFVHQILLTLSSKPNVSSRVMSPDIFLIPKLMWKKFAHKKSQIGLNKTK